MSAHRLKASKLPFPLLCSISDFLPLFASLEHTFEALHGCEIDGVELVIGLKSRWSARSVTRLAQRYALPILSLHQPVWASLGLGFDEKVFHLATELGVPSVVVHPLPRYALLDSPMQRYLERLAVAQERYGVRVLLENLPRRYYNPLIEWLFGRTPAHPAEVCDAARTHNLAMTFDTSHAMYKAPQRMEWFSTVVAQAANIHLSSFSADRTHLPLHTGELDTDGFLRALLALNYAGTVTLEVFYPRMLNLLAWDTKALHQSVLAVRAVEEGSRQRVA